MDVTHLKRWHWIAISLVVGLAIGYIQSSLGPEGFAFSGQHNSIGQEDLERAIARKPIGGKPVVKNLRVYPDGNKFLLECSVLQRSKDPRDPSKTSYKDFLLATDVPFQPVADLRQTVNVGIHPAATPRFHLGTAGLVKVNMWPHPIVAKFEGWKTIDSTAADPGADGSVAFPLRPAEYQLTFSAVGATTAQMAHVTLKLNNHPLPPLQPASHGGDSSLWQTTVTPDGFIRADRQVLHVSRGDEPVAVREIRLLDPTYTVVDYLSEVAVSHPEASYRMAWWTNPKAAYSVWTLGSLILIGGIWPTLVRAVAGPLPVEIDQQKPKENAPEPANTPEQPLAGSGTVRADERNGVLAQAKSDSVPKLTADLLEPPVLVPSVPKPDKKDFKGVYYPVKRVRSEGFSLVELLVVIGIIALLIGLLMPSLVKARQDSQRVQCMSNMRQVGMSLQIYSNAWNGAMFPPLLGDSQPLNNRWPVFVFQPPVYNPPIMTCPSDQEPMAEHSYILNSHLTEHHVTYSNTQAFGVTPSEVIVMGEKVTNKGDYYMDAEEGDYTVKVDFYKHGLQIGSNYLYLDLHVETDMPTPTQSLELDPWDPLGVPPTNITTTE